MESYILYTYQEVDGETVCHAYGPTSQEAAQSVGEQMKSNEAGLGFMVLQLETLPE